MKAYGVLVLFIVGCAQHLRAQSVMYSPLTISSPDLVTYDTMYDILYAYNQGGLLVPFVSGVTPWVAYNDSDFCSALHSPVSGYSEFWADVPNATDLGHLVLDMGDTLSWDRLAFFNEEHKGFGTQPIVVERADSADGPWYFVTSCQLTEHIAGAFGPDVIHFQPVVASRYFRITGSGPGPSSHLPGQYAYAVGEIVLGTADPLAPAGSCLCEQAAEAVPTLTDVSSGVQLISDPFSGTLVVRSDEQILSLTCIDALGRSISLSGTGPELDISVLPHGLYQLWITSRTTDRVIGSFVR